VETDTGKQNLSLVDVIITRCADGSYCCGFNSTRCCEKKAGYWVANGKVTGHNGEAQQPFLLDASEPSGRNDTSSRLQSTLKIALGVGLGVGLPFIGLLAANLWFLLRRRQGSTDIQQSPDTGGKRRSRNPTAVPQHEMNRHQVELEQPKAELYQPTPELEELQIAELDSSPTSPALDEPAEIKTLRN
jgi:hypothetical protein